MIITKEKIKVIIGYLLIYLMVLIPASNLYTNLFNNNMFRLIICGILILPSLLFAKYRSKYVWILLVFLTLVSIFIRLINNGGVGLDSLVMYFNCILIVNLAYNYQREFFIKRFLNVILILSIISCVGFVVALIVPYKKLLTLPIFIKYEMAGSYYREYTGIGAFFYSFLPNHINRNTSIFTEPGKAQIYFNTALFFLLFCKHSTNKKKTNLYLAFFTIAIITGMSTTGYIAMVAIFLVYFFTKAKLNNIKPIVAPLMFLFILTIVLSLDFVINGDNSFFNRAIISKLFDEGGNFNLGESTGQFRIATLITSLEIALSNWTGVGYDKYHAIVSETGRHVSGGDLALFLGVYGLIPFILLLVFVFYPLAKNKKCPLYILVLYIFLFFNTGLAQSNSLYPGLIIIPFFYHFMKTTPNTPDISYNKK